MIGVIIDHKLAQISQKIKFTFNYIFNTIGLSFMYVDGISCEADFDIIFLYAPLEVTKDDKEEIRKNYRNGVVIFIQADPELFIPSRLTKEYIENNTKELKLFDTFPILCKRNFDNPIEGFRSDNDYWGNFNFDIIGNTFYHLCGYDEKIIGQIDNYGRYTDNSLSFMSYTRVPYANYLLWMMENYIKDIAYEHPCVSIVRKEYWPNAENFACAISHNIDRLQKWDASSFIKSCFSDLYMLIGFKFPLLFQSIKEKLKYLFSNDELYWRFADIQQILNQYSVRATWFVGALEESDEQGEIDYLLDDADLQEELRNIIGNNGEVAILTDINSEKNNEIEKHKSRLSNLLTGRIKGIRNVIGKYDSETTPLCYDNIGVLYDSGKFLCEQVGFRNGIAFPYKTYLLTQTEEREAKHWEVPLIFSDHFLQLTKYKQVSKDKAKDIVKRLIKVVRDCNGLITFNFTMSKFNDITYIPNLMEYTLRLLKDRDCYMGTISELIEWWEKRLQVSIQKDEETITVWSSQDIKQITLSLWGGNKVTDVTGAGYFEKDNRVTLKNIKKNTEVIIHTPVNEQMSIDISTDENPTAQ